MYLVLPKTRADLEQKDDVILVCDAGGGTTVSQQSTSSIKLNPNSREDVNVLKLVSDKGHPLRLAALSRSEGIVGEVVCRTIPN
jgi:hypothetical protein